MWVCQEHHVQLLRIARLKGQVQPKYQWKLFAHMDAEIEALRPTACSQRACPK
jgi:hypothetical protein